MGSIIFDMEKGMIKYPDFKEFKSLPLRRSLGQYVYENLKESIVDGSLAPGSRIIESQVAKALDISRTPVREAIHKLEREGLLCKYPTGGLFVAGLTRAEIDETFGIRAVLESYAARLAALAHNGHELSAVEEKIDEYQRCLEKGRLEDLPRINTEFHDMLYALSRSPKLIRLINNLREQIYRFRRMILKMEDWARTSNDDHRQIVAYIKRRDAEGVERLVREHILKGKEAVLREYDMQDVI